MIFLIGMPASGKTSVGKALAKRLGTKFVDLDREVERAAKMSIARIFAEEHEWGFRVREAHALLELVRRGPERAVVATGGGAPAFGQNLHVMAHGGTIVYLRATLETLGARKGLLKRPILAAHPRGPKAGLAALFKLRRPFYQQAEVMVDVDGQTPAAIARALADAVGALPARTGHA